MKKIALAAALLAAPVFAEDAAVETVDNVAIEQQHAAYEGFYFGIGAAAADNGAKCELEYPGITPFAKILNGNATRLMGTVALGFGKKLQGKGFYAGIEAGLDFGPASTSGNFDGNAGNLPGVWTAGYDIEVRHNGFVPALGLRLGFVDCETKIMTYLKVGASYLKTVADYRTFDATDDTEATKCNVKTSTITPFVALGIEKAFAKKMTARVEAEYKFGKNKTSGSPANAAQAGNIPAGNIPEHNIKLTQKGTITLRAMFCYNVKI